MSHGAEATTIEGLAVDGTMRTLQQASGAASCPICSAVALV